MKIGSSVVMAIAVLCVLSLTQGCVTTESQGSGRGPGAKLRGPFKHEHKDKVSSDTGIIGGNDFTGFEGEASMINDSLGFEESEYISAVEPDQGASFMGSTEVYIVQKGDVLSQLAIDYDTTTANMVSMNNLSNPDVLFVGQEINVPAGRNVAKTTHKPTTSVKKGSSYTIQKGDTLSGIAVAAGVSLNDLRSLNGINGDVIMAGESIDIPSYGKVPSSKRKTTKKASPTQAPEVLDAPEPSSTFGAPDVDVAPADTVPTNIMVVDEVMYPGDTLDIKARQYGVSKAEIMRLNNITDESLVRDGDTIRIPVSE